MKTQLLTLLLCLFTTGILFSQENNAIACSDGIDNDGDGDIDCEDSECKDISNLGCLFCSDGLSFADVLLEYNPGCPNFDQNPEGALGMSDWNGSPTDVFEFVWLGDGGSIKLGFTNNLLTNSASSAIDLWIFEIGTAAEEMEIALKPANLYTATQLSNLGYPDSNSDGYYEMGALNGGTSGLEIDVLMPGYSAHQLKFNAVEVKDVPGDGCAASTPGADIDAICAITFEAVDCAGVADGTSIFDDCGECLEPTDPLFNQSCIDCEGVINGPLVLDSCGVCIHPTDPEFNQSCQDCSGVPNGTAVIDSCGLCLELTDSLFNITCLDCQGIINGGFEIDQCGECLDPSDPMFGLSCLDCNGTLFGTAVVDSCGLCLELTDSLFNITCEDCRGIIGGGFQIDQCGECMDPMDPTFGQSCVDCEGVIDGTKVVDSCGECLEPTDPLFNQTCFDCEGTPAGEAVFDECGVCLKPSSAAYNQSCDPDQRVYVPNAFSPNNDGKNDVFEIFLPARLNAKINQFVIFGRWGDLVYSAKNIEFGPFTKWWDGKFKDKHLEPGVFVYYISVEYDNGKIEEYRGDVSVLR